MGQFSAKKFTPEPIGGGRKQGSCPLVAWLPVLTMAKAVDLVRFVTAMHVSVSIEW
jgi:hypothetical protein